MSSTVTLFECGDMMLGRGAAGRRRISGTGRKAVVVPAELVISWLLLLVFLLAVAAGATFPSPPMLSTPHPRPGRGSTIVRRAAADGRGALLFVAGFTVVFAGGVLRRSAHRHLSSVWPTC